MSWLDGLLTGTTIVNPDGNAMPARGRLQFIGSEVTDSEATDATVVTNTGGGGGGSSEYAAGVLDLDALRAVTSGNREDRQVRLVESNGELYWYDADTGANEADDSDRSVKPADVLLASNGRWRRTLSLVPSLTVDTIDSSGAGVTVDDDLDVTGAFTCGTFGASTLETDTLDTLTSGGMAIKHEGAVRAEVIASGVKLYTGAVSSEVLRVNVTATEATFTDPLFIGSTTSTAEATGIVHLPNNKFLWFRNAANNANIRAFGVDSTGVQVGSNTGAAAVLIGSSDKLRFFVGTEYMRIETGLQLFDVDVGQGGATKVISVGNAPAAPTTDPTAGYIQYGLSDNGVYVRRADGVVVQEA